MPALMKVLVRDDGRLVCPRCAAAYLPPLTRWSCPVCRTASPGAPTAHARSLRPADRTLLIVGLATVVNLVVLAVLAALVLAS
jgi:hypothetical protein